MRIEIESKFDVGDKVKLKFGSHKRTGSIIKCQYVLGTIRYLVAMNNEEVLWIDELNLDKIDSPKH